MTTELREVDEAFARFLGSFFYAPGHDREDLEQEARIAMLGADAPQFRRRVAKHRIVDVVRMARRRAFVSVDPLDSDDEEVVDPFASSYDLLEHVAARERLWTAIEEARTPLAREALGRRFRGEPIVYAEKGLQSALLRLQRRLGDA